MKKKRGFNLQHALRIVRPELLKLYSDRPNQPIRPPRRKPQPKVTDGHVCKESRR